MRHMASRISVRSKKVNLDGSEITKRNTSLVSSVNRINMSEINLYNLTSNLKDSLDVRTPSTIFFKKRQNRILSLDVEKQRWLLSKIEGIRLLGISLNNLHADAIISEQMIALLAQNKLMNAQIEYEKHVRDLKYIHFEIKQIEHQIKELDYKAIKLQYDLLKEEEDLRRMRIANDNLHKISQGIDYENEYKYELVNKIKAEIENIQRRGKEIDIDNFGKQIDNISKMISNRGLQIDNYKKIVENQGRVIRNEGITLENRITKTKAEILESFVLDMKKRKMPLGLKTYAIASLFNTVGADLSQHERDQILNKYLDKEMKIKVRKDIYEASSVKSKSISDKSQAMATKMKAKKAIKRMKEND